MSAVLVLSDDLLFTSRITSVGRDRGLTVTQARSVAVLLELASRETPRCVIVDLENPGLPIVELVARLKEYSPPPHLVAYGSHVDAASLHAARVAGCDLVLPRSAFVDQLPEKLAEWTG